MVRESQGIVREKSKKSKGISDSKIRTNLDACSVKCFLFFVSVFISSRFHKVYFIFFRYKLLLDTLLEKTDQDHSDYKRLKGE